MVPKTGAWMVSGFLLLLVVVPVAGAAAPDDLHRQRRHALVRNHLENPGRGWAITDTRVLAAMRTVERHRFVPGAYRSQAYRNTPLPIGHGQTISQPYIVAFMTQKLKLEPTDRVLEIGTGSGYQAAVLARIVDRVYSIEIIPELAQSAQKRLADLGYENVTTRQGDGYYGWEEHAPFDAIIVTASPSHIPPPLMDQLKPGGRLVVPVGPPFRTQQLMLVKKTDRGTFRKQSLMPVRFVPFRRSK